MECLVLEMLQVHKAQLLKLLPQAHVALDCHIRTELLEMLPEMMKLLESQQVLLQARS